MSTTTPSSIRKKRSSFSLSSFRKPAPPAPAARPVSIGDVVLPTKRPTLQERLPPDHPMQLPASAAASPKDHGLHTHMGDVVDRLQQKQKSNPQCEEAAEDEKVTSTPVAPVASSHGIHPSTPVSSALHKFFNKVSFISSIMKSSKKSAPALRVLAMPNKALPDTEVNEQEDKQYHIYHYIHHHHHHHHYGHSPDKEGAVLGCHRRHSESSEAFYQYMPSLREAEEDEDDDEVESPIKAFLDARSTRHSEDFLCGGCMPWKDQHSNNHVGGFAMMGEPVMRRKDQDSSSHADEFAMIGEFVIKSSPQLPRRYNSARFTTPNNIQAPGHGNTRMSKEGQKEIEGRIGRQSRKSFQESIHTKMEEGKEIGNGGTRRHSAEILTKEDHYSKTARTQRVPHPPPQLRYSET